jgi:hypothetical protein
MVDIHHPVVAEGCRVVAVVDIHHPVVAEGCRVVAVVVVVSWHLPRDPSDCL